MTWPTYSSNIILCRPRKILKSCPDLRHILGKNQVIIVTERKLAMLNMEKNIFHLCNECLPCEQCMLGL